MLVTQYRNRSAAALLQVETNLRAGRQSKFSSTTKAKLITGIGVIYTGDAWDMSTPLFEVARFSPPSQHHFLKIETNSHHVRSCPSAAAVVPACCWLGCKVIKISTQVWNYKLRLNNSQQHVQENCCCSFDNVIRAQGSLTHDDHWVLFAGFYSI